MREIKFRGKYGNNPWLYGSLVTKNRNNNGIQERNSSVTILVDDGSIGQYTGMHDCNGKEIYEGDIVKTNFDDVGVVTMGEHNGVNGSEAFNIGFYIIWDSYDDRSWMRNDLLYFIKKIGVTVIGNRWDNHELLGGENDDK